MKDFNWSVSTLVSAYLNNTLEHGNCAACAVGNMIAVSCDYKLLPHGLTRDLRWHKPFGELGFEKVNALWQAVFHTKSDLANGIHEQRVDECMYKKFTGVKDQIDSTGYSWQELARIEYAFESAPQGDSDDEYMFNGLMACVDVLADIHGISLEDAQQAKLLFVK